MGGLVGELQYVLQAFARIRHFLLGEAREARVETEAVERGLQVTGEVLQLGEQIRRGRVGARSGLEGSGFAHRVVLSGAVAGVRLRPPGRRGSCRSFPSA